MKKLLILMMISSNLLFASKQVNSMIDKIIQIEGSGVEGNGISRYGVTLDTMKAYKIDSNGDGVINKKDVYSMTKPKAVNFYKKLYNELFPHEKNSTVNEVLMPVVFDSAVNQGSFFAKNTLIKATNKIVSRHRKQGKVIFDVTKATVFPFLNTLSVEELKEINNLIVKMRIDRYVYLANRNKNLKKYLKGWSTRAKTFLL